MTRAEDHLGEQLEAAYAAIQELDEDLAAGRISAADHAELKKKSELQAAALLARLRRAEQQGPQPETDTPDRATFGARLRGPIGLAIGAVALVVVGVVAGALVARSSDPTPAMPAADAGVATPPAALEGGSQLEALRSEVEPEETPTKKLLAFAHLALDEGQTPAAIWAYKRVLAREPKNVEAITHMGVILYQADHLDQGLARLREAVALDPGYAHAHWDLAQILFHGKKDYPAAVRAIEGFLALVPTGEDADRARAMLTEARSRARAPGPRSGLPASNAAAGPAVRFADQPRG